MTNASLVSCSMVLNMVLFLSLKHPPLIQTLIWSETFLWKKYPTLKILWQFVTQTSWKGQNRQNSPDLGDFPYFILVKKKRRHSTVLLCANWKLGIIRVLQEIMCIGVLTLSELLRIMANNIIQAYIVHTLHRTSLIGFDFHFGQAYSLFLNTVIF